jgi:hypothetical protein
VPVVQAGGIGLMSSDGRAAVNLRSFPLMILRRLVCALWVRRRQRQTFHLRSLTPI